MDQERGYLARCLLDFEDSYGAEPNTSKAWSMPVNSCGVTASRELNSPETLRGTRNPVKPTEGNLSVSGQVVVPVDAHCFPVWLRAVFGLPAAIQVAQITLNASGVVDKGGGKVGLPCTGHGLAVGAPVVISGTSHYDGAYVLAAGTSENELVIAAPHAPETLDGTETVDLARQITLDVGDAVNVGNGKVGLPCAGHGLPMGAEITVDGTTSYDGTYLVLRGTTSALLLVETSYTAETFSGTETVTAPYFDKVFTVSNTQPSFLLEKQFHTNSGVYLRSDGLKVGEMSIQVGGSGELTASMSLTGRDETLEGTVYDESPLKQPFHRFQQFQAGLSVDGGEMLGRVTSFGLGLALDLETDQYTLGSGGVLGDLPEGMISVTGNLEALFKDATLLERGIESAETSWALALVNGGYRLTFHIQESRIQRNSPSIDGPRGVVENYQVQGYQDDGSYGSALAVILRSEVKSLEV